MRFPSPSDGVTLATAELSAQPPTRLAGLGFRTSFQVWSARAVEEKTVFQPASGGSVRSGGRLNGVYEIESLIAQGGMGEVYKGFNIQTNDPVAIKMIRPELSRNPDAFALFRREASTLHNLQHEAIVRYFVFSVDPELQRAYLAMEFVDGPSLTKRLAAGALPLADVRILQRRIGGALEAAHGLGVIHRDVSSDNVILPGGDIRRAKIIDFGIARSRQLEGTIVGDGFAGKYNYVSPEQVGLAGGEVTFKSDIYSFGLVLAEALRGRPIDMGGSPVEVIEKRRVVPDLSDINPAIRPLIQAMLQPLPANRPPSMAAVAAWGDVGASSAGADNLSDHGRRRAGAATTAASSGRWAGILGALIVIVSVGVTIYVFREDVARWFKSASSLVAPVLTPAPTAAPTKLPPLGAAPATSQPAPTATPSTSAETPAPSLTPAATPSPTPLATAARPPHVPTAEELIDALPPRAPQPLIVLAPATVGKPYHEDLPAFVDPGGKGLRLTANALPSGLVFKDLGGGRSEIDGAPTRAGSASMQVVAVNHNGQTTEMAATIVIGDIQSAGRPAAVATPTPASAPIVTPTPAFAATPAPSATPPRPAQTLTVLEGARAGEDYSAALPPFDVGANGGGLALRAEPNPPDGLSFIDLGSGLSQLSGKPSAAGVFAFDVVATNPAGLSARMAIKIVVATAPTPPPAAPTIASAPVDKAGAFIAGFDGGPCFLVRPLPGASDARALQGVGDELAPFQRFDAGYTREVGVEAQLGLRLIAAAECPALDMIRLGAATGAAPRIELTSYEVGRGKPLEGTIANLAGRRLALLLVDNDGVAHRLAAKTLPGGDSATFSAPLVADASSIGPLQIVLAVASTKPIAALEGLRSAPVKELAPRVIGEAPTDSASVEAEFFKLVE
jgi:serine/threonine-protein kinase